MDTLVEWDCPVCIFCRQQAFLLVPAEGLGRWLAGALIQDALPTLSGDQREMLITGTHPACWDENMGGEE
jgi:hypothetical protein